MPKLDEDTTYEYYKFVGWSEDKLNILNEDAVIGDNIYKINYAYSFDKETTLYAVWQKVSVSVKIKFTLNGKEIENPDFIDRKSVV